MRDLKTQFVLSSTRFIWVCFLVIFKRTDLDCVELCWNGLFFLSILHVQTTSHISIFYEFCNYCLSRLLFQMILIIYLWKKWNIVCLVSFVMKTVIKFNKNISIQWYLIRWIHAVKFYLLVEKVKFLCVIMFNNHEVNKIFWWLNHVRLTCRN